MSTTLSRCTSTTSTGTLFDLKFEHYVKTEDKSRDYLNDFDRVQNYSAINFQYKDYILH